MSYLVAIILLMLGVRPVAADFAAAEAAEQRGDALAAYEACRTDAEAGDAPCQNYLGVINERGRGVTRNATEAVRLFRLAAAQGLAAAQYECGTRLRNGPWGPQEPARGRPVVPNGGGTGRSRSTKCPRHSRGDRSWQFTRP
jgi:TPR repeat protein